MNRTTAGEILCEKYLELTQKEKELKNITKERDIAKKQLIALLGEESVKEFGRYEVVKDVTSVERVDTEKLKIYFPKIHEQVKKLGEMVKITVREL